MGTQQLFLILLNRIRNLAHAKFEKVEQLPETGQYNIIYLVPKTGGGYTEYIWLETEEYDEIGTTDIDLSQYVTTEALNILREQLVNAINAESLRAQGVEEDLSGILNELEDAIEDLSESLTELENEVGDLDVCIEESLVSGGLGGYRKYNSGYMEQWGVNTLNGLTTITLYSAFKDNNYHVFTEAREIGNFFHCAYAISNSQFNCRANSMNGTAANIQLAWRCYGRWK